MAKRVTCENCGKDYVLYAEYIGSIHDDFCSEKCAREKNQNSISSAELNPYLKAKILSEEQEDL